MIYSGDERANSKRPIQVECTFVVPCFNEEHRLNTHQFEKYLQTSNGSVGFLFVDDGSTDCTKEILASICQINDCCTYISLEKNVGKAETVRTGFQYLIETSQSKLIGFLDADLAAPLTEINSLRSSMENNPDVQMILGSRVKLLGRKIERKRYRHYLGRFFATLVSTTLRLPVYDTQCGAKLFRVNETFRKVMGFPFASRWLFDVEIIARYLISQNKPLYLHKEHKETASEDLFFEVPLDYWKDVSGSKIKARDFIYAAFELLQIRRTYFNRKRSLDELSLVTKAKHSYRKEIVL